MKRDTTVRMSLIGLKMYLNGESMKAIQKKLMVSIGSMLVFRGIRYLDKKYHLNLKRDDCSIRYLILNNDADTLKEIIENEFAILDNPEIEKPLIEKVNKDYLVSLISDLHKERMIFLKEFNLINDKILLIEKHILRHDPLQTSF